jgi:sporulation integral membrane protein YtvI
MNSRLKNSGVVIGIIAAVYLSFRYMLPLIIPFFIAYLIVLCINPLVEKVHKKSKINKGLITSILLILVIGIAGISIKTLLEKLIMQCKHLIENSQVYEVYLIKALGDCSDMIEGVVGIDAASLQDYFVRHITLAFSRMKEELPPFLMSKSVWYLKEMIEFTAAFVITIVSVILLEKDYNEIKEKMNRSFYWKKTSGILERVGKSGGAYLKAQGIIMLVIAAICTAGLFILRNPYALILGVAIGLLDALPVFGTGTVFIPWAVIKFLQGDFILAAIYVTLWLVTCITREFLEPKLIGKKLGLYPIAVIMTIYIGIYVYGISGVLLGPLSLLIILEILREMKIMKEPEDGQAE